MVASVTAIEMERSRKPARRIGMSYWVFGDRKDGEGIHGLSVGSLTRLRTLGGETGFGEKLMNCFRINCI